MGAKPTTTQERIGRVGQRRQVVFPRDILIKPKRVVDPDDTLTPEQSALVKKGEREMRQGKFVTLAQLRHAMDRPHSRRRRKTA